MMLRGPKVSIETNCHQQYRFKKVLDVLVSGEKTYVYQIPKRRNWEGMEGKGGNPM